MAQTYTSSGTVHCVIFETLALTAGEEILSELFKKQINAQDIHHQMDKDNNNLWKNKTKKDQTCYTKKDKVTLPQNCGLTRIMVEESVFPPKHLRGLQDDSIRKLISHCCLSYSL